MLQVKLLSKINHYKRAAAFICALSLAATTACGAVNDEKDSKKSVPAATTVSTQSAAETITSSTTAETTSATTTTTTVAETTTIQTEPPADDGIKPYTEIDFRGRAGLVVGAEGTGISRLVRETCDFIAVLPMRGEIESLNAGVAAAICMYEMVRGLKD